MRVSFIVGGINEDLDPHSDINQVVSCSQLKRASLLGSVSIDLHQLAQRRTGPLTRVLIGDAQPNRWLVGPRRTVPYIEEVGTAAQVMRFAAATVPTVLNPNPI